MKGNARKYVIIHDKVECLTLIELVEQHPVLWKHDVKIYADRKRKNDAWRDIAAHIGESEEAVEAKWKSILTYYAREKTKQNNTRGSATSAYVSTWFAYQRLAFLGNNSRLRATVESSKVPAGASGYQNRKINKSPAPTNSSTHPPDHGCIRITETTAPTSSISHSQLAQKESTPIQSTSNPVSQKPQRKRTATANDEQFQAFFTDISRSLDIIENSQHMNDTDRYQSFGLMVTNTLRECYPAQSEAIMHGISDVIFKVKSELP